MKKIMQNSPKTKSFIDSLPKIYAIVLYAKFGVLPLPFAGKCDSSGIPYVYSYYDGNGTCDEYHLMKLTETTTGAIYAWTLSNTRANIIANSLNTTFRFAPKTQPAQEDKKK